MRAAEKRAQMRAEAISRWRDSEAARALEIEDAIETARRERLAGRRRRIALLCLLILVLGASIFLLSA